MPPLTACSSSRSATGRTPGSSCPVAGQSFTDSGSQNCATTAGSATAHADGVEHGDCSPAATIRDGDRYAGGDGHGDATPVATSTACTPTATGSAIIAMTGGDIACGTSGGGDCQQQATANILIANNPDIVLPLGDNQYECGGLSDFNNFYGPTWGSLKAKTFPSAGNHEYQVDTIAGQPCYNAPTGAPGYFTYFGNAASPNQPGCTVNCQGYYSYDAGTWHIIVLNSVCSQVGGCGLGSPEETWLKNDLAAHPNTCTLAYWHYPRFTSGLSGTTFWPA